MKWGRRKASGSTSSGQSNRQTKKIDKKIKRLERRGIINKLKQVGDHVDNALDGKKSNADKFKASNDINRKYRNSEAHRKFKIAKQKSKKDPSYKDSDEYKKLKRQNAMAYVNTILFDISK